MKSIVYTPREWEIIKFKIETDYGKTVFMIRSKTIKTLGFSVREHQVYVRQPPYEGFTPTIYDGGYKYEMHLDFVNESARLMFMLKYC